MDPLLISIVAFLAVAATVGAVAFMLQDFGTTKVEDRLQSITGGKTVAGEQNGGVTKRELVEEGMSGITSMFAGFSKRFGNMALLMEQSDSPISFETFVAISIVTATVGVGIAAVAHAPVPLYPVAALLTGVLPLFWLLFRRKSRFKKFGKQLPDALELVARALRSGHSLASGLHVVVEEMPEPISTEFRKAYEEQNLGVPLDKALKSIFKRVPNLDFKFFVTAVAIQRQSGGDLAEILDKIGHIIRERFRIMGQVQALTGEGRISGIVLMALPIALFFAVYYLNQEYVMLLFTEPLGRKMIAVAAVLQVLGAVTINKIIQIKI
jgi:tight adherence protein B